MFFFFEDLYYTNEDICQAFKKICLDKMLADGYFDMSTYIFGRIRKEDMYASLTAHRSKYAALYRGAYPKRIPSPPNGNNGLQTLNSRMDQIRPNSPMKNPAQL